MKNYKNLRVLAIVMAMVMATVLLSGCAPKVKADEVVKIMAKGVLTLDFTEFDKLDVKKEDQGKAKESALSLAKLQVKTMMMAAANIQVSDEQAQQIIAKIYEVQKKATVSTKMLSAEEKSAVVELTMQAVDGQKMAVEMEKIIRAKVQGMTNAQVQAQAGALLTAAYVEVMDKAEFKAEPAVIKVNCKLDEKENKWVLEEDAANFGARLGQTFWGTNPR